MTQYERMVRGLVYDTCDPEIMALQAPYQQKLWEFNRLSPAQGREKEAYMKEVFAECGDYCYIELPIARLCNDEECDFFRRYVQA